MDLTYQFAWFCFPLKNGASHTDWYSNLMDSGTVNTVLEFPGLEYQSAWFCFPLKNGASHTDWYWSLMDSGTVNRVLEFLGLEYQSTWFCFPLKNGASHIDWYSSLMDLSARTVFELFKLEYQVVFLILNAMSDGATVAGLLRTRVYCARVLWGTQVCRAQVLEKW